MSIPFAASAFVAHIAIIPIIRNIYPVITTIRDSLKNDKLIDEIDNRDIEASFGVIEELVNEINSKKLPTSIIRALENLERTLKKVHELLEKIHKKTINHTMKWFSSWRSLDISIETTDLIIQFNLLEKRFNLLHKVLMVYKESL
jgi:succinate dehydrogenase/fumarate reductase flavoprotein subunit